VNIERGTLRPRRSALKRTLEIAPLRPGAAHRHRRRGHAVSCICLCTMTLLGSLLPSPGAWGQQIHGRRPTSVTIRASTIATKRAKRATKTAGPARIDFEREKARRAALARNEALQSIKRRKMIALIDRVLASRTYRLSRYRRQRSLYLMRKADLQFEEARYQNMVSYEAFETAQAAFDAGKRKVPPTEPTPDYRAAIKTYRQLLKEDPSFPRGDEARFRLGYCLSQMHHTRAAAGVLAQLVSRYPRSSLVPDAYLQMGEIWFDANKFIAAMGNYQMVFRRFPRSPMAGYAEYKYAWCLYHQAKHEAAIHALADVARRRTAHLRKQALRDIVTFYAEVPRGWQRARDYLLRAGGKALAQRLLWRMARYLESHDKNEPALQVLAWLLAAAPTSARATSIHQLQVDILVRLRNPRRLDKALGEIVSFYAPGSRWMRAHRGQPSVAAAGRHLAEKALAYVATYYHREGKTSGQVDLLQRAVRTYRIFLDRFPRSRQAPAMAFYLAELLRRFGKHDEAARRYGQVVAAGKSRYREDASFQRVYCLSQLLRSRGLDRPVPSSVGTRAIPRSALSRVERRYVEASDEYSRLYPASKDTPAILFKAARIFYSHGQLRRAGERFARVIRLHPRDRYAALAGAMALDSYSRLQDWPEVVKWARHLIRIRNFKHYRRSQLRAIIAASGMKAAALLEKRGRYEEAALAMKAVYDEFPRDRNATRALFNTAVLFEKAGKLSRAMAIYKKVVKKARKSSFGARATFVLGAMSEARADFGAAARYYASLAKLPEIPQTAEALYSASVMQEALGRFHLAERTRRLYLKRYPRRPGAARALFSIGKLLEKQKAWRRAERFYLSFGKRPLARKSPTLQVAAWTRAGRCVRRAKGGKSPQAERRALGYFRNAIRTFRRLRLRPGSLAAAYAGWAKFQLAEVLFDRFDAVRLRGTGHQLVALLIKKARLREAAQRAYQGVLPFKAVVWSTAAVYKIGMLYARTVEALYGIPVPKSIRSPDERERYKAMLQERAMPVEEAARQAFRKAVAVAHRLRVYNRFTAAAARHLYKLAPESFPDPGRQVLKGGYHRLPVLAHPLGLKGGKP